MFTNSVNINTQWVEQAKKHLTEDVVLLNSSNAERYINRANILIMTERTYQNLRNKHYNLSRYKTAIYDEAHTFFTDTRIRALSDMNPDPNFPFENQILLSAVFPQVGQRGYNTFCAAFNVREPLRPPVDRLITEVPVHYRETIYTLTQNSNPAVRDNFLYRVFGSDLRLMFRTPAKMLITTTQAIEQIKKLCDILSILIESNTNDLPLVVCILRTGSEKSFKFDLSKIDKRTLLSALERLTNAYYQGDEYKMNVRNVRTNILNLVSQISNNSFGALQLTDRFLRGELSLSDFRSNLESNHHIEMTPALHNLCDKYMELHNIRSENAGATKTINGLLRDVIKNDLDNIGAEQSNDTRRLIHESNLILATNSRVEEGFNCEELVLGYFNGVRYNVTSRAQVLGRIRRRQNDGDNAEFLHNFPRYALYTVVDAFYRRMDTIFERRSFAMMRNRGINARGRRNADNNEIIEDSPEFVQLYRDLYNANNFNYEKQAEMDTRNNYISHNRLEDEAAYNRVHNNVIVPNPNLFYEERQEYEFDLKAIIDYVKDYLDRQDKQNK